MEWVNSWLANPEISFFIIYIFTAIIYQLAFARRLPILKTMIIYVVLGVGCILFTVFHGMGLPIIPALTIALTLIVVFRIKMYIDSRSSERK
ncbi:MAG: YlaH-like family protein [Bacilli bacterium]